MRAGQLNRPVIDRWWQTETGWAISGDPVGLGTIRKITGAEACKMPAAIGDLAILDEITDALQMRNLIG